MLRGLPSASVAAGTSYCQSEIQTFHGSSSTSSRSPIIQLMLAGETFADPAAIALAPSRQASVGDPVAASDYLVADAAILSKDISLRLQLSSYGLLLMIPNLPIALFAISNQNADYSLRADVS